MKSNYILGVAGPQQIIRGGGGMLETAEWSLNSSKQPLTQPNFDTTGDKFAKANP